jgi:hypothetical protein
LQGGLKPHPTLQYILDSLLDKTKQQHQFYYEQQQHRSTAAAPAWTYMTLHARVEPDMQKHQVCKDKKVYRLSEIIEFIYTKWPSPPVHMVFIPINRQYLEQEAAVDKTNQIAVDNLNVLNEITTRGMWNNTIPVVEFGSNALRGSVYEERPSTAGAVLNYFMTLQEECTVFVGTEVSSFSHDVLASRFYRYNGIRQYENYKYLPSGLHEWITPDTIDPPGHLC